MVPGGCQASEPTALGSKIWIRALPCCGSDEARRVFCSLTRVGPLPGVSGCQIRRETPYLIRHRRACRYPSDALQCDAMRCERKAVLCPSRHPTAFLRPPPLWWQQTQDEEGVSHR